MRSRLLGKEGLIKIGRSKMGMERQARTEAAKREFASVNTLDGLDNRVNDFLSTLKTINDQVQDEIYFDFQLIAQKAQGLLPIAQGLEDIFSRVLAPGGLSPIADFRLTALRFLRGGCAERS